MMGIRCGFVAAIVSLVASFPAAQGLAEFAGRWQNTDPATRGIAAIEIRTTRTGASVHLWGACVPKDCDMGEHPAVAYSQNVTATLTDSTKALVVQLGTSRFVVLRLGIRSELMCESFSQFNDGTERTNVVNADTFKLRPVPSRRH